MIRTLVVDDEELARERLREMLAAHAEIEVVGEAGDGVRALEAVAALRPELVFLDIEMPELSGIAVAQALGKYGPRIIFVTAYDEHAVRAFDLHAVDYVLKPVSAPRLAEAVGRVVGKPAGAPPPAAALAPLAGRTGKRMAVRCGARFVVINPAEIVAIEAQGDYAAVILHDRELLTDDSLEALIGRLDADEFLRVHRKAIINLAHLKELVRSEARHYEAVMGDAKERRVPVARERLAQLKERLGV